MNTLLARLSTALLLALLASCGGESGPDSSDAAPEVASSDAPAPAGRALTGAPARLLDLALAMADEYPLDPYEKNRARAQELVVATAFELGDAQRGLDAAEHIENWRRALGYADFALHLARNGGERAAVQEWIDRAETVARAIQEEENPQKWRHDRVLGRIAKVHLALGDREAASPYMVNLEPKETGVVQEAIAAALDGADFDAHASALEALVTTGDFFRQRAGIDGAAALHARFYTDPARRARCEQVIRTAYDELPHDIRVLALLTLADHAAAHTDAENALRLVREARAYVDGSRWQPADHVRLLADVARRRAAAGDATKARIELDAALTIYDEGEATIVDIDRAEPLQALAEAYLALGDRAAAGATYARAVEAAMHNPNSRPRTDDVVALCCSMARQGFEPDPALWTRLEEIRGILWVAERERLGG